MEDSIIVNYVEKVIKDLEIKLKDPDNFTQNRHAEKAIAKSIEVKDNGT